MAQTALTFDVRPEYEEAIERLKVLAGEHRIGPYMRKGAALEAMCNWEESIQAFSEVVRLSPEHGPGRLRLAYNLMMGAQDPHEASAHAQKAAALLPDDPEAHFVLGMCYEKSGMDKAALRAYSRAIELRPSYVEVKKRLKKLKWGF
jgi:tetratricopeptide (TPR) repeat protein